MAKDVTESLDSRTVDERAPGRISDVSRRDGTPAEAYNEALDGVTAVAGLVE